MKRTSLFFWLALSKSQQPFLWYPFPHLQDAILASQLVRAASIEVT
jgi:hypothetical protein